MTCEIKKLVFELDIDAPTDQVWRALLDELPEWWPADFLCFKEAEKISFEPWAGGRLYEQTPDGKHILWATVAMIIPGKVMEFVGSITPTYGGPMLSMYKFQVEEVEPGKSRFKLEDTLMGNIHEQTEQSMNEGWAYLFTSLKSYVEGKAA